MPYKDPEKQRAFQREWLAARRDEWLKGRSCEKCGRSEQLQVDHRDPSTKVSHRIWSWSEGRRRAELEKCQVLCTPCHFAKTGAENSVPIPHGTDSGYWHHACRCEACREAHRLRRRSDRAKYGC